MDCGNAVVREDDHRNAFRYCCCDPSLLVGLGLCFSITAFILSAISLAVAWRGNTKRTTRGEGVGDGFLGGCSGDI